MKLLSFVAVGIIFTATLASLVIVAPAFAGASLISQTSYPLVSWGVVQVAFDSILMTSVPPQAYAFGAMAKTTQGLWITTLVWNFGDGAMLEVPYCCHAQVSEVRYHIYS